MEGQKHIGVVVTTISKPDAAEARAWEEKWRSEAASAAGHGGAVDRGIAFRVAPGYDLGGATHVAIYETQLKDVAAATQRIAADDGDGETTLGYTTIAEYGPISDGRTRGVVLVFTDCDDPAEEDVFNEWYSGHLHHTVEAIDFYAATRYVSNDPSRTAFQVLRHLREPERRPGPGPEGRRRLVGKWRLRGPQGHAAAQRGAGRAHRLTSAARNLRTGILPARILRRCPRSARS